MEEKRMFVLNEDDLRTVVKSMVKMVLDELRSPDFHDDMEDLMTIADISEMIDVDPKNLYGSQRYYTPFDRQSYKGPRGAVCWKRRDVLEHLARRDSDIKKSYQEFCERNSMEEYENNSAIYSAKAMMAETKSDGATNTYAPSQP